MRKLITLLKKKMRVEVLWLYVGVVFFSVVFVVVFLVDSLFFSSLFKIESGAKVKRLLIHLLCACSVCFVACSRLNLEPIVRRQQQTLWKDL